MDLVFTIQYYTRWGEDLFLRNGARSFPMGYVDNGIWRVRISSDEFFQEKSVVEYFYEVKTYGVSTRHEWRAHTLKFETLESTSEAKIEDSWSDIDGWKGAGTAIPVFSLRSEEDFGVGEFLDLKKFVDWAASTGQTIIQVLPINDTTMTGDWMDSYPYNANSTFALNPIYINLEAAGVLPDEKFRRLRKELNSLDKLDYVKVSKAKDSYLHEAFENTAASVTHCKSYRQFIHANQSWLLPYAAFCALRDEYGTPDFSQWGEMAKFNEGKVNEWCKAHRKEIGFICFVQYHLDSQLREVRDYAHSKGVILKGDLPIGISRTSADAWQNPHLFNMDSQAGAPPDAFAADGQNWGFPTYNWDEMAKDGYSWWKGRLGKMNEYFDAFRIDHILGFFRIWEIPIPKKSGLEGHFSPALPYSKDELMSWGYGDRMDLFIEDPRRPGWYHPRINAKEQLGELYNDFFFHRHNDFWKKNAIDKLSALLGASNMLTCGEDLGMIPACVPEVMDSMNILSLEIQRMPKKIGETFGNPASYPYRCVCTTSTHDMSPLRAWWKEDREMTQRFFSEVLGCRGKAPETAEAWICQKILKLNLDSPAMLVILPLQDWLSVSDSLRRKGDPSDERINIPAICPYYWRYRMHLNIEDLCDAEEFNKGITELIKDSGRSRM